MSDKPSVLFVCVHNAGRSQMAAGWLRHLAGDAVEVRSAGSLPADQVNAAAVDAMAEVGVDIAGQQPKVLSTEAVEASDIVITMGCGDVCPISQASAARTGSSKTPQAKASRWCGPSATRSSPASATWSMSWRPPVNEANR